MSPKAIRLLSLADVVSSEINARQTTIEKHLIESAHGLAIIELQRSINSLRAFCLEVLNLLPEIQPGSEEADQIGDSFRHALVLINELQKLTKQVVDDQRIDQSVRETLANRLN